MDDAITQPVEDPRPRKRPNPSTDTSGGKLVAILEPEANL